MRNIFCIFFFICLFAATPSLASPSTHPSLDHKTLKKERLAAGPNHLAQLNGRIKSKHIRDANLLARAIMEVENNHFEAAENLLKKTSRHTLLSDYALFYKAQALAGQKKYDEALKWLKPLRNPAKKIENEQLWLSLKLLALTGQTQKLNEELQLFKKSGHKDREFIIHQAFVLGLAEWTQENQQKAFNHFRTILVAHPGSEYDKQIFDLFKSKKISTQKVLSEAQWNKRAENLMHNGFPHKALKIWEHFYRENPAYLERLAHVAFKGRDYPRAAELYEQVLRNGADKTPGLTTLVRLAQAYARHDNFEKAIAVNEQILKTHPGTSHAKKIPFKLAYLYFDAGNYEKAAQKFEEITHKASPAERGQAHWFHMWSYYLLGQYPQALKALEEGLPQHPKKDIKTKFTYWRARLLEKSGQKDEARSLYEKAAQGNGLEYYSLMARQRLSEGKLHPNTIINQKNLFMIPQGTEHVTHHAVTFEQLPEDDALIRAVLLAQIGLDQFAYDESRFAFPVWTTPTAPLARAAASAGNHHYGYTIRHAALNGGLPGMAPVEGFLLAFPRAFRKYVEPSAMRWGVPENMIYAVMRQESAFQPHVASAASAFGLMQIIPPTGDEIAEKIGFRDFDASLLYEPAVNVLFGAFYLHDLLKRFDDNIVHAVAAYNAGPDAVTRWLRKTEELEADEFIELIPYAETGNYVKKVLVNFLVYERLYPK